MYKIQDLFERKFFMETKYARICMTVDPRLSWALPDDGPLPMDEVGQASTWWVQQIDPDSAPTGWKAFGVCGGVPSSDIKQTRKREIKPGTVEQKMPAWTYFLSCPKNKDFWSSLMTFQEFASPSISPHLLLPLLFIAKMGAYDQVTLETSRLFPHWCEVFVKSNTLLIPLVDGLIGKWLQGDSASAKELLVRSGSYIAPPLPPEDLIAVERFTDLVGEEKILEISNAEHLEMKMLALLDDASNSLWMNPATPEMNSVIRGLLPLAAMDKGRHPQWKDNLPANILIVEDRWKNREISK